jgi:hypothetical protein
MIITSCQRQQSLPSQPRLPWWLVRVWLFSSGNVVECIPLVHVLNVLNAIRNSLQKSIEGEELGVVVFFA